MIKKNKKEKMKEIFFKRSFLLANEAFCFFLVGPEFLGPKKEKGKRKRKRKGKGKKGEEKRERMKEKEEGKSRRGGEGREKERGGEGRSFVTPKERG